MLNEQVLYHFIQELEANGYTIDEHTKEAFYGKLYQKGVDKLEAGLFKAYKAGIASKNPLARGAATQFGNLITNPDNFQLISDMNKGVQTVGPGFALATAKGEGIRRAIKPVLGQAADKLTWEYKNSPFGEAVLAPVSSAIDSVYGAVGGLF